MRNLLLVVVGGTVLMGCASRPVLEMTFADSALRAAQKAKAESLAPDYYRKAENYFLKAKKDYHDGYFDAAGRYARDARLLAEQAEYRALLKQSLSKPGLVNEPGPTVPLDPGPL